ncbi:MAG: hypothetical protein ACM3PR_03460 [Bacteroidales bacterium]
MNILYNIMLIYGLTFVIGFFVAFIIWVLFNTMAPKDSNKIIRRESYSEMKRLKHKNVKTAQ